MRSIKLILLSLLVLIFFSSCGDDNPTQPETPANGLTTKFDVNFTDNTIYIDSNDVQYLKKYDKDAGIYTFDKNFDKITNVQVGDILLIYGLALRKVSSIQDNNDEITIQTSYATLNEAIRDGEIAWNKEINFRGGEAPQVLLKGNIYEIPRITDDGFDFNIKIGEYTYNIKFTNSTNKTDIKFEIEKDIAGKIKGKFICEGSIEKFYSKADIKYNDSKLRSFSQNNDHLKGNLKLSLVVAASGKDALTLELPVVLLKFPIMVGPVPVTINLKVMFVANGYVPLDGSSQVDVNFSFNSGTGISYDGTKVIPEGSIGNYSISKNITQTGASSAISASFGLGFPRLEIGMFDDIIVPWIHTAFLIGGDYTFTPPCQQAKAQFIGACGLNLKFLGFGYSGSKTLWQKEKILLKSGDCP